MTNLRVFLFDTQPVRILGTPDDPLFVAKDVLEAIGSSTKVTDLKNMIVEDLGKEFVTNQHLDTPGGKQEMLLLTEPALTLFISRSRTELGKRLNRWIHAEVLPAIRKTGSYSTEPASEKLLIEREKTERERVKAQAKLDELRLKHELKLTELERKVEIQVAKKVHHVHPSVEKNFQPDATITVFLNEALVYEPQTKTLTRNLYRQYEQYCQGQNKKPLNQKRFVQELRNLCNHFGLEVNWKRRGGGNNPSSFEGLKIKENSIN
ncbi:MAG: hypothetical protein KA714_26075 [Limnoraphis sp. WC205]|nr:hypothetical protein [Limnoraphis sp. WC205]